MSYNQFQLTEAEVDRIKAKNARKAIRAYIKQYGTEPSDISSYYTATNAELEHYRRIIYAEQMVTGEGGGSVSPIVQSAPLVKFEYKTTSGGNWTEGTINEKWENMNTVLVTGELYEVRLTYNGEVANVTGFWFEDSWGDKLDPEGGSVDFFLGDPTISLVDGKTIVSGRVSNDGVLPAELVLYWPSPNPNEGDFIAVTAVVENN